MNSGIYVHFFLSRPNTYKSAQYVRMSLKEPLMYKRCPKWLFWGVYLDANKHFSLQKSTKLYRTPMKFSLGTKITFFEKWPQVTLLNEFNVEK